MADDKDKRDLFTKMVGLGVGGGTAYWQFRKTRKTGVSDFRAVLDPRANILHRIQSINVDNAFNKAVRKFSIDHISRKLDEFGQLMLHNRLPTIKAVNERLRNVGATGIPTDRTMVTQLFRREWDAAIKATFPNPVEAKILHSVHDPLGAIRASLRANPSVLMHRAFYTFQKNVSKVLGMGSWEHVPLVPVSASIKDVPTMAKLEVAGLGSLGSAKLSGTIESIQTALDTKLSIAHRGKIGEGEFIFTIPGRNKPIFTIAESFAAEAGQVKGLIRTGAGLHNIYAPGIFGIVNQSNDIAEELTYSELKAKRILEAIQANNLTNDHPHLLSTIQAAEAEVDKLADYMEPNISHSGYSLETFFKSNQMTVLDAEGRLITGQARRDVAARMYNKTGGAFTPASSESRFSILPQEQVYGPFAAELDYARKPWQFIRQYTPTSSAMAENAASPFAGEGFSFLDSPMAIKSFNGPSGARAKTLYLSDDQINQLRNEFGITIGDGELLLHESMKKKLAVSRFKRINLNELDSRVAQQILNGGYSLDNLSEQVTMNIPVRGILGRNAEGTLISTRYPTSIVGISPTLTKKLDKTTRTSLDLITKEEIGMTDTEKVFGSLKGIARFIQGDSQGLLGNALAKLGINNDDLKDITAIARVSDIKDTARYKQALVSHWALQPHGAGAPSTSEIVNALKGLSEDQSEAYMLDLARKFGGGVFDKKLGGVAVSSLYFGGEAELTGAGNIGTLEPRIFTLLAGSNPAGQGENISNELLERMIRWAPEKVTMHNELMKTLESLNGTLSPSGLILKAGDASNSTRVGELLQKGGFLETGVPQVPHLYIPGWETVPELHPRMVSTGAVVETSQPSKIYRNIIKDVAAANKTENPLTAEQFFENFNRSGGYLTQLFQEAAVAGKGAGSIARGNLAGSRALRIVSETDAFNQGSFEATLRGLNISEAAENRTIGVPVNMAHDMFEEMKQIYGADEVANMEKRFFSGELIAGMAMRHPTIGAYSMQPVLMKAIHTDLPNVIIPERMKRFSAGGFEKDIQTGILPGMAADKDADTALAILLSSNMEEKMRAALLNEQSALSQSLNSYRDHSIRMQLLKPKAAAERVTMANYAEQRAAEATKLAITQEEVGKLSTALTKSRVAVMASNLSDERKLTSLSLLEWLEQQPISGKHIGLSAALSGAFEQQMQAVQLGAGGNANMLKGAIASMLEGTDEKMKPLMPLFKEGMETSEGFVSGFKAFSNDGAAAGQTVEDITSAIQSFKGLPEGSQLAAAVRYASPSVGTSVRFDQLSTAIMANRIKPSSTFAEGSRGLLASINREMSNIVNRARPYAKPALIGLAAAGAAMSLLGPPPGAMKAPGPEEAPRTELTNANRDDIQIPGITQGVAGQPTASPLLASRQVQMNTASHERRKSTRLKVSATGITEEQRQQLAQRLNNRYPNSAINMRVQDDRRSLNPHVVSDMMNN